jgi:hypothetical protein
MLWDFDVQNFNIHGVHMATEKIEVTTPKKLKFKVLNIHSLLILHICCNDVG